MSTPNTHAATISPDSAGRYCGARWAVNTATVAQADRLLDARRGALGDDLASLNGRDAASWLARVLEPDAVIDDETARQLWEEELVTVERFLPLINDAEFVRAFASGALEVMADELPDTEEW